MTVRTLTFLLVIITLSSCLSNKRVVYFQSKSYKLEQPYLEKVT